jgi:hypothetical protein
LRSWKTYFRWFRRKPLVRPWALAAPIVVLLICLPLMRPLRHPDPSLVSDDEQSRLATIQAVVEQHTLEVQRTSFFATQDVIKINRPDGRPHWYSDQSPVMAVLLSGPYWVMYHHGLTFERNPVLVEFLLTLLGVTLPIAFAAGLLYRMARMFELRRPYRAALALAVVIGSGWISYATILSAGAAAAALVVMSAACLVQAALTTRRPAALAWIACCGFCAALAGTYELTGLAFLVFLMVVICALKWPAWTRAGAMGLYIAGAMLPLTLYARLNKPITGDLRPGFMHNQDAELMPDQRTTADPRFAEDDEEPAGFWRTAWHGTERFLLVFVGGHGLLTHFPILILGIIGMSMVMHRHWPMTTKLLASATVLSALGVVIGYTLQQPDWKDAMFANRWFVVFLPLTLFWSGAWLRRSHRPLAWATVAVLWAISGGIALVGATDPQPRQGYDRYSAAAAFMNLVQPPPLHEQRNLVATR